MRRYQRWWSSSLMPCNKSAGVIDGRADGPRLTRTERRAVGTPSGETGPTPASLLAVSSRNLRSGARLFSSAAPDDGPTVYSRCTL